MAGSRTRWWIYRFELAYFNPRYQRWALFQENPLLLQLAERPNPTTELVRHRTQVQAVLKSVRSAFESIPRGTRFGIWPLPEITEGKTITLNFGPPGLADRISTAFGPDPTNTWRPILSEYTKLLDDEGLRATSSDLPELLQELADWDKFTSTYPKWQKDVSAMSALQLLSILPILPHWDLWGVFYAESRRFLTERAAAAPSESGDRLPTLLHLAARLDEPFYAAHLKYLPTRNTVPSAHSHHVPPSIDLLGYEVRLAVTYCDLSGSSLSGTHVVEDDYYCYCFNPKGRSKEELPYLIYAYLIDHLQKAVPGQQPKEQVQDIYYFSYPIFTPLGRTHFLDVYVHPEEGEGSLDDLWEAWQQVHPLLQWDHLRLLLADELEEIDIGYAQALLSRDINEAMAKPEYRPGESLPLPELLCQHGHVLFPARAFTAGRDQVPFHYCSKTVGVFDFGKEWDNREIFEDTLSLRRVATSVGEVFYIPDVSASAERASSVLHAVADARRDRIIQEELELAQRLQGARETEVRAEEQRILEARARVRDEFLTRGPAACATTQTEVLQAASPDINPTDYNETLRELLRDCVKRGATDDEILETARKLFIYSYTVLASEYFGLGPVKRVTHEAPFYEAPNMEQFRTDCMRQFAIAEWSFRLERAYQELCGAFHSEVLAHLNEVSDTGYVYSGTLHLRRKTNHQFQYVWHEGQPAPAIAQPTDVLSAPQGLENVVWPELYLPIHRIFQGLFEGLSALFHRYRDTDGSRYAFALDLGVVHPACWYPKERPTLHRNYFIWCYPGCWSFEELTSRRPSAVEAIQANELFQRCGSLSVAFKTHDGISWWQWRAQGWCEIQAVGGLLPTGRQDVVSGIFNHLGKGCAWFLTFDSWIHRRAT